MEKIIGCPGIDARIMVDALQARIQDDVADWSTGQQCGERRKRRAANVSRCSHKEFMATSIAVHVKNAEQRCNTMSQPPSSTPTRNGANREHGAE